MSCIYINKTKSNLLPEWIQNFAPKYLNFILFFYNKKKSNIIHVFNFNNLCAIIAVWQRHVVWSFKETFFKCDLSKIEPFNVIIKVYRYWSISPLSCFILWPIYNLTASSYWLESWKVSHFAEQNGEKRHPCSHRFMPGFTLNWRCSL